MHSLLSDLLLCVNRSGTLHNIIILEKIFLLSNVFSAN